MAMNLTLAKKKLSALLDGDAMVDAYLKKYGTEINLNYLEDIRKNAPKGPKKIAGEQTDSYYSVKVRCPICKQGDILCYELKAKSQVIYYDRFMAPTYKGLPGQKTVNYTNMAVTVCPKCFFASPDKKDFITYSMITRSEAPSNIGSAVVFDLKKSIPMRQKMMEKVKNSAGAFKIPRSGDPVILSYKLSMHRALVEAKLEMPYSLYKAGSYALRIAALQKEAGQEPLKAYEEAVKLLSKSFSQSNAPDPNVEYKTVYIVIALCLRLEKTKEASEYMAVFDKIRSKLKSEEKAGKKTNFGILDKWDKMSKDIWERREEEGLWNTPAP